MSIKYFLVVGAFLYFAINSGMIQACLFSTQKISNPPKRIVYAEKKAAKNYSRRNTTNFTCECGFDADPYSVKKPWILYLHFNTTKGSRVCPGTIVNSNLVLASHKCLRKSERINKVTFPIKATKVMNFPKVEEITLSTEIDLRSENATFFKIEKILYRDEYAAEYIITGANAPESDVVILVVKHNKTNITFNNWHNNSAIAPICVPKWQQIPMDLILNKEAFYQGVRGWDDHKYKYAIGVGNFTLVKTAKQCSGSKFGGGVVTNSDDSLCLEYVAPGPTTEGGPLRFTVMSIFEEEVEQEPEEEEVKEKFIRGRSYLIGIATHVDRSMKNAHHKYAYFTNINSIVKYVEETAQKEKSEWCETPTFYGDEYPWSNFEEGQDESLDCDCGEALPEPSSRIFDGTPAKKNEFPWLVKFITTELKIVNEQYKLEDIICAGSLINSRMILTAANCITESDLITGHGSNFNILYHSSWNQKVPQNQNYTKTPDKFYEIYVFSHYFDRNIDTDYTIPGNIPPGIKARVKKIIFHPQYPEEFLADRFNYDVALVVLENNLETNLENPGIWQLRQICLPKKGDLAKVIKEKTNGTVAGWGGEEKLLELEAHEVLTKTNVQAHEFDFCAQESQKLSNGSAYKPPKAIQPETNMLICASAAGHLIETSSVSNPTPYKGDNGAPLMYQLENGTTTQVGIFSHFVYHSHKKYIRQDPIDPDATSVATTLKGVTYYQNVEPLLPFINYYSKLEGAKGCRQRH